jgi:hypothetical protein
MQISALLSSLSKFAMPFGKNAGSGYIRPIPTPSQVGIVNGAASLNDGFPPLTFQPVGSGGIPPFGQDFNGILNQVTAWNQWQQAGGSVQFDSTFCTSIGGYPQWAILASTVTVGLLWLNTVDNNTTNPDSGGASGWIAWGPSGQLLHYGTDTGSANAIAVSSVTPTVGTVATGMMFEVTKSSATNTAAMTGTIAGTSGGVVWGDGTALRANDWPASSTGLLYYDGANFRILTSFVRASVFQPSATINFYVNGAIGTDANDGLSNTAGHAFATMPGAVSAITSRFLSLGTANVSVAAGTYAGWTINPSGVANWVFSGSGSGSCIISSSNVSINLGRGFIGNYGTNSTFAGGFGFSTYYENINCSGGSITVSGTCAFSAPTNTSAPMIGAYGGYVAIGGSHTYTGTTAAVILSRSATIGLGYYDLATSTPLTMTATGTTAFTVGFAYATLCGTIVAYPTVVTWSGSATGPRYSAINNGTIFTAGAGANFFPGNSAGSTATGGQYS